MGAALTATQCVLEHARRRLVETLSTANLGPVVVEARVKTTEAVASKRARRPGARVNDLLGLRVVVDHGGLIGSALSCVAVWASAMGLELVNTDDYFTDPGLGGYRAFHLDYEIAAPESVGLPGDAGVEVQVTTGLLSVIARVSHALAYREGPGDQDRLHASLAAIAEDALRLDSRLAQLCVGTRADGAGAGKRPSQS